jgi:hypothetical protein
MELRQKEGTGLYEFGELWTHVAGLIFVIKSTV